MRLQALAGARFFAAAWVLVMHFAVVGALGPRDGTAHAKWLEFWITTGGAGVGFFFVLSGFVLAHTYTQYFASGHLPADARAVRCGFWRARVFRIYPTYLLALLVTTGSALWLGYHGASPWNACTLTSCGGAWLLSAIPVQAWFPDPAIQQLWNAPGWSIAAEVFFYALFPILIRPIVAGAQRWGWGVVVAIWTLQNLGFAALNALIPSLVGLFSLEGLSLWLERLPLLRLPEFATGIAAWAIWRRTRQVTNFLPMPAWPFWGLVGVLCSMWFLPVPTSAEWLHSLASSKAYSLAPPLFAMLIIHLANTSDRPPHLAARALAWRPVVLLGEASYALYILHWAVLQSLFALFRPLDVPPPWAGYAAMGAAVFLSVIVHLWFELPLRRYLARKPVCG